MRMRTKTRLRKVSRPTDKLNTDRASRIAKIAMALTKTNLLQAICTPILPEMDAPPLYMARFITRWHEEYPRSPKAPSRDKTILQRTHSYVTTCPVRTGGFEIASDIPNQPQQRATPPSHVENIPTADVPR